MSSPSPRTDSEERAKELDAPEAQASTSTSKSSPGTTPDQVDDNGQDHDSEANDDEDKDKTTDKADRSASVDTPADDNGTPSQGDWQAIWAPAQNAYYFHNIRTNETTWTNPLYPQAQAEGAPGAEEAGASMSNSMASTSNSMSASQAAAEAAGIDPSLAYLDPSLGLPGTPAGTFIAKFNARTGAFTRMDARDPSHLSETERAKRMSEVYFDVGAWETEIELRKEQEAAEVAEGGGKKRKRPTKKDLERFKEQKRLKKIAKTAWLRT